MANFDPSMSQNPLVYFDETWRGVTSHPIWQLW